MGKTSKSQLTKKTSVLTLHSPLSKQRMNCPIRAKKSEIMKKQDRGKTKKKIQKLFDTLRRESTSSFDLSGDASNVTVISIDSSYDDAALNVDLQTRKRQNTSMGGNQTKKIKNISNTNLIVINDDEHMTNNDQCCMGSPNRITSHINCSTPITKTDKKVMQDLIVDNFTNNNSSSVQNFNEDVINLTKEVHADSYVTVDLTTDSECNQMNTVIDVENDINEDDCTFVSAGNSSLSLSGVSEDMVPTNKQQNKKEIKKFTSGIAKLNSSQKGKLLEYIAQKIFSGCNAPVKLKASLNEIRQSVTAATETAEDAYIKEVILGEAASRNSIGSNIYRPGRETAARRGLRMIVIDGSNVAMDHTKGRMFSVKGLKICIDYFVRRGHVVKAFVPRFRCKFGKSSDPRMLDSLERQGVVVYTPSREVQGRNIVPYDDRYIVQCAAEFDGVIVSGDNYRDLLLENPRWRSVIEARLLPFTWVDDLIMFPRDPLGRNGPTLEQFLRHPDSNTIPVLCTNET